MTLIFGNLEKFKKLQFCKSNCFPNHIFPKHCYLKILIISIYQAECNKWKIEVSKLYLRRDYLQSLTLISANHFSTSISVYFLHSTSACDNDMISESTITCLLLNRVIYNGFLSIFLPFKRYHSHQLSLNHCYDRSVYWREKAMKSDPLITVTSKCPFIDE